MEKEISLSTAREFLKRKALAVISTVSPGNKPQAATVLYFIDDDFNFYFATRRDTRKFTNLASNANVAIVVGADPSPMTIQMEGTAKLDARTGEDFLKELIKRPEVMELYSGPFAALRGIDFATFRVKITWMRFLNIDPETGKEEYFQLV